MRKKVNKTERFNETIESVCELPLRIRFIVK